MFSKNLYLSFDKKEIEIKLNTDGKYEGKIPEWSQLDLFPCPGNRNYGPDINYCRLSLEINQLVKFFY